MNKESLKELKEIIVNGLDESKTMNYLDKTELMLNLRKMLESEETYNKSIKVLRKEFKKGR